MEDIGKFGRFGRFGRGLIGMAWKASGTLLERGRLGHQCIVLCTLYLKCVRSILCTYSVLSYAGLWTLSTTLYVHPVHSVHSVQGPEYTIRCTYAYSDIDCMVQFWKTLVQSGSFLVCQIEQVEQFQATRFPINSVGEIVLYAGFSSWSVLISLATLGSTLIPQSAVNRERSEFSTLQLK